MLGVGEGLFSPVSRGLSSDLFVEKRGWAFGVHCVANEFAGIFAAVMSIVVVLT